MAIRTVLREDHEQQSNTPWMRGMGRWRRGSGGSGGGGGGCSRSNWHDQHHHHHRDRMHGVTGSWAVHPPAPPASSSSSATATTATTSESQSATPKHGVVDEQQIEEQRLVDLAIQESLGNVAQSAAKSFVTAVGSNAAAAASPAAGNNINNGDAPYTGKLVAHLTLADKNASTVLPGARIVKAWRLKNEGPLSWPQGTKLIWVGGEALSAPATGIDVPSASPGESVDIAVPFVAPSVEGRYTSYWRLKAPNGGRFGHRVWIDLFVESSGEPSSSSSSTTTTSAAATSSRVDSADKAGDGSQ